ncbi:hypothetical protein AAG906_026225 [Vitis piasezkii]
MFVIQRKESAMHNDARPYETASSHSDDPTETIEAWVIQNLEHLMSLASFVAQDIATLHVRSSEGLSGCALTPPDEAMNVERNKDERSTDFSKPTHDFVVCCAGQDASIWIEVGCYLGYESRKTMLEASMFYLKQGFDLQSKANLGRPPNALPDGEKPLYHHISAGAHLWASIALSTRGDCSLMAKAKVAQSGDAAALLVINDKEGTAYGSLENPKLTFSQGVKLRAGVNTIALLSIAVGLPNVGPHFETWNAGVLGLVSLNCLNEGRRDLSWQKWSYKVGIKGEALSLHSLSGNSSVEWVEGSLMARGQPLTWYKTTFNGPGGNAPLALDMGSMGKGQIWKNGQNVGRYWSAYKATGGCGDCNYAGTYSEKEFVDWVRCIKILYPQEVQQMSLDGDIGNSVLQKEACNSVLLVSHG